MTLDLTPANFDEQVLQSDTPVLVDFWAPWCAPCKLMEPVIAEVAEDLNGKVLFGKVNVDEGQELAQKYNILSVPTFIVFKSGEVVDQFSGSMTEIDMKAKLEKHI